MKQPKVTDTSNHLLIQKELIKIESYGENLKSNKDALTTVSSVYNPFRIKPEPRIKALTAFLNDNDCLKLTGEVKDTCYRKTRVILIQASKLLDEAESDVYFLNRSVGILKGNIETIIDTFPEIKH